MGGNGRPEFGDRLYWLGMRHYIFSFSYFSLLGFFVVWGFFFSFLVFARRWRENCIVTNLKRKEGGGDQAGEGFGLDSLGLGIVCAPFPFFCCFDDERPFDGS